MGPPGSDSTTRGFRDESFIVPGQRVQHPEFGEGVVVEISHDGYVRAFFSVGEKQIRRARWRRSLTAPKRYSVTWRPVHESAFDERGWVRGPRAAAHGDAAALTAAKIDLLPHQVVLTHRIATASPRRFLIADEVGLGKTIETALILRELASRGELKRALMVVPAGLVNNWHRELNEVFHLDFEVFGSEGDVTDRKSNAFAKHDRLIASIDTLKRPRRVQAAAGGAAVGLGRVRRGAPPDGLPQRQEGPEDRELQAGRGAEGALPRLAVAVGHAAPGRPLPLLDADPAAEPDAVQSPRDMVREPPPAELRGVPPHQGRCLPAGRLDRCSPGAGSTPSRSSCPRTERGFTRRSASTSRTASRWPSGRATKGGRSAS